MKPRILVVDQASQAREIATALVELRADVRRAKSTRSAIKELGQFKPQVLITELEGPGLSGLEILEKLKDSPKGDATLSLIVTSDPGRTATLAAFDLGASDFLVKPFDERELRARVQVLLRRLRPTPPAGAIESAGMVLEPEAHRVTRKNEEIPLTRIEFSLLLLFVRKAGRALSRDYLLEYLWGASMAGNTRTIDMHVSHLRSKLANDGKRIETVQGVGYRFRA